MILRPRHYLYIGGVVFLALAVFMVLRWGGFVWDPSGRLRRDAAAYSREAAARSLETEGQAEQAQRVDTFHHETITVLTAAAQSEAELRSLPDAETPLNPVRADRLRSADSRLCETHPGLCAPADPSGGR